MKLSRPIYDYQPSRSVHRHVSRRGKPGMWVYVTIALLLAIVPVWWRIFSVPVDNRAELSLSAGLSIPLQPTPTRNPDQPLVGLVMGHDGYDPGAVCPDGLTEAELNKTFSLEVAELLRRKNVDVDLLQEFDDRLPGYQADALVSIHSDSCLVPEASGYKVARITLSAIPEAEDRLVACLRQEYAAATGLPEHPSSITDGMTNYHAFREIDSLTPGAIIETGFMLEDRYTLEHRPKIVARGIASGILCFLKQQP